MASRLSGMTNITQTNQYPDKCVPCSHPEVLALHQLDLLAPAWAGQRGKLNWLFLANSVHCAGHMLYCTQIL